MKQFIIICAAIVAVGCGTHTATMTANTPSGVVSVKHNEGPYSDDTTRTVDTTGAMNECMARLAPAYSTAIAYQQCMGMVGGGVGVGYGMGATGVSVVVPGGPFPVTMPSTLTPAQAAVQDLPSSGVAVVVPQPAAQASSSSDDTNAALLTRELAHQQKELNELKKAQAAPADSAGKPEPSNPKAPKKEQETSK